MPYKHEKKGITIPKEYDRRVKLTEEQREEIRQQYGKISQRKLAKEFGVSRRLIQFIGDPEKAEKNKLLYKLRGGSTLYYNKEKHREYMKEHRRYKHSLDKKGVLENKNGNISNNKGTEQED